MVFEGLTEIRLRPIQKYVSTFDTEAVRFFVDPSLRQHWGKGSFALVSPEALVSQRATFERQAIPVFSVSTLQHQGLGNKQIREKRETFIEEELKPALTEEEFAWLAETVSLTGPESVDRLARRRAEAAMPDWLREVAEGEDKSDG